MNTILLNTKVVVSDPCYEIPTWCQAIVDNVNPGRYHIHVVKSDEGDWGTRCSHLIAIHEDHCHQNEKFQWKHYPAEIGVDSGQAGIFSIETYRKDDVFNGQKPDFNYTPWKDDGGEMWYAHMCDRTLNNEQWGHYDQGVVSSSGYGDGVYELLVATKNNKVIGFVINFLLDKRSIKRVVNEEFLTRI